MRFHPLTGQPSERKKLPGPTTREMLRLSYDAARGGVLDNYWAHVDKLDADSANSVQVRARLVQRSRYETANNGYAEGILRTHCNYLVGCGPKLRMQTENAEFNREVETAWWEWDQAVKLRRKLWCAAHAKKQDGEGFGVCRTNKGLRHPIKLDLILVETEQCTTPNLATWIQGHIDGIEFDPESGEPTVYSFLRSHPGAALGYPFEPAERVPAKFVLHVFALERPGQHRGIPEHKSVLNTGAQSRRFREATVISAEVAACISALFETGFDPNSEDVTDVSEMTATQFRHGMVAAAPYGYKVSQLRAEHPNTTYDTFIKSHLEEWARPLSMPFGIASGNSSSYNFASARIDRLNYNVALDSEREDFNQLWLDPLFDLWWEEGLLRYGWSADEFPYHCWDWPQHPVIDVQSEAEANKVQLETFQTTLSQTYSKAGLDFEDQIEQAARDFGITPDEMRGVIFKKLWGGADAKEPGGDADADGEGGVDAGGGDDSEAGDSGV